VRGIGCVPISELLHLCVALDESTSELLHLCVALDVWMREMLRPCMYIIAAQARPKEERSVGCVSIYVFVCKSSSCYL